MKWKYVVLISLISAVIGFVLGRLGKTDKKVIETKETIKYAPIPFPVTDTIYQPQPYNVYIPADTVTKYVTKLQNVDTAQILQDYCLVRQYKLDFSNDTLGEFRVDAEVGQNKLLKASSYVRPLTKTIYKETTVTECKKKAFQPFILVGTSPRFDLQKVTIGVDLSQRYLIGVSGIRWDNKYNYSIDFGIKLF